MSTASAWTIGIMTGSIEGTSLRMVNDMAVELNDGPNLRIVPMVGESSIRNVSDLSYLKGVDVAVVQSDVLSLSAAHEENAGHRGSASIYSEAAFRGIPCTVADEISCVWPI